MPGVEPCQNNFPATLAHQKKARKRALPRKTSPTGLRREERSTESRSGAVPEGSLYVSGQACSLPESNSEPAALPTSTIAISHHDHVSRRGPPHESVAHRGVGGRPHALAGEPQPAAVIPSAISRS